MRKTILHVKEIMLSRLNKAEFLGFLTRVMNLLVKIRDAQSSGGDSGYPEVQSETGDVAELYIDEELLTELQSCLDQLTEMTRETRSNLLTEELAQLDRDRDAILSYIFNTLEKASKLPLATQREAGRILHNALKVYSDIIRLPQTQETVEIRGMLLDLAKETLAPHVETMGLAPYIAELKRINDLFEDKSQTRSDETAPSEVKTKEIRKQAGSLYQEIAERAFAANLLHESETTLQFIKDLNRLIDTTIADYNRRRADKSGTSGSDETPQPEPDEDTKPDEGEKPNPDEGQTGGEGENPNPDGGQTGGEEENPDDRPVVQ